MTDRQWYLSVLNDRRIDLLAQLNLKPGSEKRKDLEQLLREVDLELAAQEEILPDAGL